MNTELLHTEFPATREPLRFVLIVGDPWFVVADVCRILGLTNPSKVAKALAPDERRTVDVRDSALISSDGGPANPAQEVYTRGNPRATATNPSGLYTLILRSRKSTARPFRDWVTRELLPSIREGNAVVTRRLMVDHHLLEVRSDGSIHCPHGQMRLIAPRTEQEAPFEPHLLCVAANDAGLRRPSMHHPCQLVPVAAVLRHLLTSRKFSTGWG